MLLKTQTTVTTSITTTTLALTVLLIGNNYSSITVGGADTFNYDKTNLTTRSFGPSEWGNVTCPNVESCPGWPTNWERFNAFLPYDGMQNQCLDCTATMPNDTSTLTQDERDYFRKCRTGFQSPIDLKRNVTLTQSCKDRHQMIINKGNCRFDEMNFQVLPHVLRAYQPQRCDAESKIDFSMGFPVPWLLEFTDISVPSHHTQDGRQYDAEVVMSHTYTKIGSDRLLSNVAVFLEKGSNDDHKDFLELYLRAWGVNILRMRRACDLGVPVGSDNWDTMEEELDLLFESTEVPSAAPSDSPSVSFEPSTQPSASNAPSVSASPSSSTRPSASPSFSKDPSESPSTTQSPSTQPSDYPITHEPTILSTGARERELRRYRPTAAPSSHFPSLSPSSSAKPSESPAPSASPSWSSFPSVSPSFSNAPSVSAAPSISAAPSTSSMPSSMPSSSPTIAPEFIDKKWYNGTWDPYNWIVMTDTEYYFRYVGSAVEPPCFVGVHWRVVRRPVKISPRQLYWLSKLLKLRLNPTTCENDNVGRPAGANNKVEVNRPTQVVYGAHEVVYCECINWNSTKVDDWAYCNMTMEERGVGERQFQPTYFPTAAPSMSASPTVTAPPSDSPSSVPSSFPSTAAPSTASPIAAPNTASPPSAASPSSVPPPRPSPPTTQRTSKPVAFDAIQGPTSGSVLPFIQMGSLWHLVVPLVFALI